MRVVENMSHLRNKHSISPTPKQDTSQLARYMIYDILDSIN